MAQVIIAHDILCDTVDLRNEALTVQFLLNLTNSMVAFLFGTLNVLHTLLKGSIDDAEMITSIIFLIFSTFYLYFIDFLIICAALVKYEGNKSACFLQKSVKLDRGSVALTNIYNLQLQHRPAQISAGFFDCDLTLFYMVSLKFF